jgi:drug/metabolite transporter (DMT)-like permease
VPSPRLAGSNVTAALSPRAKGVTLATVGALCIVPDATLIRLVDVDHLGTAFWKSLLLGFSVLLLVTVRYGRATPRAYRALGRTGVCAAALWATVMATLPYAVNHTAVANALVILATASFFAAVFTRLLLAEAIPAHTLMAMVAASGAIALTFASALRLGGLNGNLAMVVTAACVGLYLTVVRRADGIDMLPAASLGGFLGAAVLLPFAWPIGVSGRDALLLALMGLVLSPTTLVCQTTAVRFLPSPEVTMIMTLETVLGPLLAWIVIDEEPPPLTAVGAVIVVATLVLHSLVARRREKELATKLVLAN